MFKSDPVQNMLNLPEAKQPSSLGSTQSAGLHIFVMESEGLGFWGFWVLKVQGLGLRTCRREKATVA